ncbi:MAG TPA: sialidase family protein [Acidimicrobiales bacterium]|nr:sialidase family protein [Acidimicrobiales bacterium]
MTSRTMKGLAATLVGLVLLVGVGLALTSGGGGDPEVGGNILVNREGIIDVSNSPTVAANPARDGNVVVTYRKDRPGYDGLISYSFNGGESWEQSVLPLPQGITGCTASQGAPCPFAPDVAFAPDGTLYVTYVNLVGNGNRPDNLWISTSTDGGRTLSLPTKIAGPLTFQQRVTVDPKGPVYVTYVQATEVGFLRFAEPPPRIVTARSDDGGKTFGAPVPVSDANRPRVLAPSPILDRDGQLVVMYQDMKGNRRDYEYQEGPAAELPVALVLTRSTDGGRTFAPGTEFETDILLTRRFLPFLPEVPQLAISPGGTLYATWADGRDGDDDVFMRSSTDGGQSWRPPVKVNDNPADGTAQFLPKVAVGPGERVSVVFLDGRNDPTQKKMLDAFLATSTNGGTSFDNLQLTVKPFDDSIGPTFGDLYGTDFGTRLGLASGGGKLYASWVDTSAGTPATGRQDVNFAVIDLPSGTSRGPLLLGILVAAVLGAALALALSRRGRTDPSTRTDAQNRQVVSS